MTKTHLGDKYGQADCNPDFHHVKTTRDQNKVTCRKCFKIIKIMKEIERTNQKL